MPKKIPKEEFETIVAVVAAHPDGVKIDAIRKGLDIILPHRKHGDVYDIMLFIAFWVGSGLALQHFTRHEIG